MRNIFQQWRTYFSSCFRTDKIMYASTITTKPRNKTIEVPVHRQQHESERKTVTKASSRKQRHRSSERYHKSPHRSIQESIPGVPHENEDNKISSKQLWKENLQLAKEKEEVIAKFNELEELSVKKITKLREKVSVLQNEKLEIEAENSNLKLRLNEVLSEYEEVRNQLEFSKICHGCEEFKAALEKFSSENSYLKKMKQELTEDLGMLKTVVFRLVFRLIRWRVNMIPKAK
ncbi:hypothetical protein HHI36_002437 [Cryptolaemus montrouzieri]|uniref:Uncharacterized protein n=1 Tax=Cryptolaemus montrouzieri TaxID=559131 RepID=A0ABD2PAP3_9CUCU